MANPSQLPVAGEAKDPEENPTVASSPKADLCSKSLSLYSQMGVVPTFFLKQTEMITETTGLTKTD